MNVARGTFQSQLDPRIAWLLHELEYGLLARSVPELIYAQSSLSDGNSKRWF